MDEHQIRGLRTELNGLLRFRRQQNYLSFLAFFANVVIAGTGFYLKHKGMEERTYIPFFITAGVLYIFAFVSYCRYKGRSPFWVMTILTLYFSLLFLALLRDKLGKRVEFLQGILPPDDVAEDDQIELLEPA